MNKTTVKEQQKSENTLKKQAVKNKAKPVESGGPKGPEPTRYGDWERKGRCIDF